MTERGTQTHWQVFHPSSTLKDIFDREAFENESVEDQCDMGNSDETECDEECQSEVDHFYCEENFISDKTAYHISILVTRKVI